MSALEFEVQPMITALMDGRKIRISRNQGLSLVRWCQKTAAMFDHYTPDPPVIEQAVFTALQQGTAAPGLWDIRLARVDESAFDCYSHTPYAVQSFRLEDGKKFEESDISRDSSAMIGVQSLIVAGPIVFMVRYSPHGFRGSASLDADYFLVDWPPATLLSCRGGRTAKILKPGGWPTYSIDDIQAWSLWVVTADGEPVWVKVEDDGSTWVDDLQTVMGDDCEVTRGETMPIDVKALFRQPLDE